VVADAEPESRGFPLTGVLTAMGLLELAGAVSAGMRPQDLGLLAVGLAAAAGLGAARGATVTVSVRDGRPFAGCVTRPGAVPTARNFAP